MAGKPQSSLNGAGCGNRGRGSRPSGEHRNRSIVLHVLDSNASPCLDAAPRTLDSLQESRIVLELIVEPIVLVLAPDPFELRQLDNLDLRIPAYMRSLAPCSVSSPSRHLFSRFERCLLSVARFTVRVSEANEFSGLLGADHGETRAHSPKAISPRPLFSMKLRSEESCTSNWDRKT